MPYLIKPPLLLLLLGLSCLGWSATALAESPVPPSPVLLVQMPTIPPGTLEPPRPIPPLPNTLPDSRAPAPLKPTQPLPSESIPDLPLQVRVQRVEVLGSTVFSPQALAAVTAPFIGKTATFEQLAGISTAITELYTSNGYMTSGAFLPAQDISSGYVKIQVVEGDLEQIEVKGLTHLQTNYVRSRIARAGRSPLNLRHLEEALQLLQLDPLFSSISAELSAGTTPGRSVLTVNLKEANPLTLALLLENRESPSVGSLGGTITLSHINFFGLGDRALAEVEKTEGITNYDVGYSVPLNARDGTLSLRYANGKNRIIEQPFARIGINSRSETVSLGFRQPIIRTQRQEVSLGLSLERRQSQTYLLDDIPFSFSVGPEKGESKVTVLRFSQDWVKRSKRQVLAARSQFSLGLDALGATINNTGTDGRFFSWLGQFQWVQSLGKDSISIVRVGGQLTGDSLLPLEQFSVGGIDTVRGYRQNQQVGDNGAIASAEVRLPIVRDPEGVGLIQLAPFIDFGKVWNSKGAVSTDDTLLSVGIGLHWQINRLFTARLDYGIPLIAVEHRGNSLQDNGVTFSVEMRPF